MKRTSWAWLCVAVVLPAGCDSTTGGGAPVRLTPVSNPDFADLPVPRGFTMVNVESMDMTSGTLRLVQHVYQGSGERLSVRDFYFEQMPLGRWRLVNAHNEQGVYTLIFEKEQEACQVRISKHGRFGMGCRIRTKVYPRIQTEAPPGKQ